MMVAKLTVCFSQCPFLVTPLQSNGAVQARDRFLQECMDRVAKALPYLKTGGKPHKDQASHLKVMER
jgi:hypothetical protein